MSYFPLLRAFVAYTSPVFSSTRKEDCAFEMKKCTWKKIIRMSLKALPLLYVNMAGEMLYILEQRLKVLMSQEDSEKGPRVIRDLVMAIFKKERLEAAFKPKELPTRLEMRSVFNKLAHVSVMKLTTNSMDKLFDLMTMSCKYQLMLIEFPEQLLTITVNHLVGIREICKGSVECMVLLDSAHAMLYTLYRVTPTWEWIIIKNTMLGFFQGSHVKVSMLMREQRQNDDGGFVLRPEGEPINITTDQATPGNTTYFENGEQTHSTDWPVKRTYATIETKDSFNLESDEPRSTLLGGNMYARGGSQSLQIKGAGGVCKEEMLPSGNEMKLFEQLFVGPRATGSPSSEDMMDLSLFESEKEEKRYEKDSKITRIDASKPKKSLNSAMQEMKLGKEDTPKKTKGKGVDMLDLMDEAAARPATGKKPAVRSRPASKDARPASKDCRPASRAPSSGPGTRDRSASVKARASSVARSPSTKPPPSSKGPPRSASASRKASAL